MKQLLIELKFGETEALVFQCLLRGEQTLKRLEEMTSLRQPQVSSAVSRLAKRGLVVKRLLPLPERHGLKRQGRPEKVAAVHMHGLVSLISKAEHLMGDYDKDIKALKGCLQKFGGEK